MKSDQKKALKAQAHSLKPVVITGQAGLTQAVLTEIGLALDHHELIKVRVNAEDRDARREMADAICQDTGAELIQALGHVITIYRKNPEMAIKVTKPSGSRNKPTARPRSSAKNRPAASRPRSPRDR